MIAEETPTISLVADNEQRPTRTEAEEAVRTLIRWIGDNPNREGLIDTPQRFIDAYGEFFCGYNEDPVAVLSRVFEEAHGYDDMVLLKDIALESHCEHHIVPILGKAHIAYMPAGRVVGISKLARVVDIFAKRLQTQEVLTAQIADTIQAILKPHGVAVLIESTHSCMTTRGVHKDGASMITTRFTGVMAENQPLQDRFLHALK